MKKYLIVLLVLVLGKISYAQGTAAVPFLELSQSPLLEGTGRIGAALPMQDAGGFYYNPAQLGYFATENNFAVSFMPDKTNWLKNISGNISWQTYSAAAGYNFGKDAGKLPLSIGIGYIRNKMSYGDYVVILKNNTRVNSNPYDSFDSFSMGVSYNYYVLFNLGFSFKSFHSVPSYIQTADGSLKPSEVKSTAVDFGAMIITPVSRLLFDNVKYDLDKNSFVKPLVNFTLGYSLTNLGKEIAYIDQAQHDPIPRTARLGYTFDLGLKLFINKMTMNAVDYSFTAEAEDLLIQNNQPGIQYKGMFGDISVGKNLVLLKGNKNVIMHRGHIFRIFETFILTSGRLTGAGYNDPKSNAMGFSSEGIGKFLSATIDNPVIKYIAEHFVIEYYNATEFADSMLESNLKGISVFVKNISL